MSRSSIRRQIKKYQKLKSEAEDKLRELEEQLEHLIEFKNRYNLGKDDFNYNLNNRKMRVNNVSGMSQEIKSGQAYSVGMNDDLTGEKNVKVMYYVECVSERIERIIKVLEYEIEQEKEKIQNYEEKIEELYRRLSREDD